MEKQKGPKNFIVVLSGGIIEIPQDSDKSWLTLFYRLPRELAEKWKPAYELPRCPYEVLRTDKYDHIVCDDMFKLLVWDCGSRGNNLIFSLRRIALIFEHKFSIGFKSGLYAGKYSNFMPACCKSV